MLRSDLKSSNPDYVVYQKDNYAAVSAYSEEHSMHFKLSLKDEQLIHILSDVISKMPRHKKTLLNRQYRHIIKSELVKAFLGSINDIQSLYSRQFADSLKIYLPYILRIHLEESE